MPIFHHKRRRLFFAAESTPGTAISAATLYAAANGKLPVYDLKVTPGVENMDRNPDGLTFDSLDSIRWGENYTVTFQSDAYTAALGVAPAWGLLAKSCGLAETISAGASVAYTVDSDAVPTLTMGIEMSNDAGTATRRVTLAGAIGSYTLASDALGKPGRFSWTFTGKVIATPDADSTPVATVVYDDTVAKLPQLRSTTLTDGGVSLQCNSVSFDRGLSSEWETDMGDATGYLKRIIASSRPTLTIDPAKMTAAAQATLNQLFKGTTGAVVVTWGSVAGTRIKLNLPRAQKDSMSDDARGVTSTWGTTFHANRSSVTGNGDDAVTLVLD